MLFPGSLATEDSCPLCFPEPTRRRAKRWPCPMKSTSLKESLVNQDLHAVKGSACCTSLLPNSAFLSSCHLLKV